MKLQLSSFLGVVLLLAVLPLSSCITPILPPTIDAVNKAKVPPVQVPGTGSVSEDFGSTTFLDGGATTASGWGSGSLTNTRNISVTTLGMYITGAICFDVDVHGRALFASVMDASLGADFQIFDISNPTTILPLAVLNGWAYQSVLEVSGDWAMMSSLLPGSGVGFYNVTSLTSPIMGGFVGSITGNATDMEVQGHFCYLAVNNSISGQGFQIIDIENPVVPTLLPTSYLSVSCQGLTIAGQIAYLAEGPLGITLLNISNPYIVTPIATLPLPTGMAMDILVEGDLAYVAAGLGGVYIVNCSGPPAIIGYFDTPGCARRLALQSNTLIVADTTSGTILLDVADPTHPSLAVHLPSSPVYDVELYGGDIIIAVSNGIYIVRIAGDSAGVTGLQSTAAWSLPWELFDIRVEAGIAYVAGGPDGFYACDLTHPHGFAFLDRYADPGRFYRKLDMQGNYAYVADYGAGGGLRVFDVANPYHIQLVDTYSLNFATDVFVDGEVVYVCNGDQLVILNASAPFNLSFITMITGLTNATSCWVQGTTLYITSDFAWWYFDITSIASPVMLAGWTLGGTHYDMYVDGDVAYLGELTNAAYILNVSDPNTASLSGVFGSPVYQCWGFGPYMVTANGTAGVGLVDASNIISGVYLPGMAFPAGRMESVVVSGDYVYACGEIFLLILRIYKGAASSFFTGTHSAVSLELDSTDQQIENATISAVDSWVPSGTSLGFELSADGGVHWESVTPGVEHNFLYPGTDLRFRVNITTPYYDVSAHLHEITIDYEYNDVPSTPTLTDPGTTDTDGNFTVSWSASTDDGVIDHYELQMSSSAAFTTILDSWTPTGTSQAITSLSDGDYFFRVRAVDDDAAASPWSSSQSIEVAIQPFTPPPPIPGFPIAAITIGVVIGVGGSIALRRRKHASK